MRGWGSSLLYFSPSPQNSAQLLVILAIIMEIAAAGLLIFCLAIGSSNGKASLAS